jgi:hypothetical protein
MGDVMRSEGLLAALLLCFAAPAAAQAAPSKFWEVTDGRLDFRLAKLSAPRWAAGVEYYEATEFSHRGEGVDNAIKYRSADQKILATLYVYLPSLAHTGVHAIATDQAIRGNTRSPSLKPLGAGVASAAGKGDVAVTADYEHYLGDNYTKAALIQAGPWMVKVRVTGPEGRSGAVNAVMTTLLGGLRFEGQAQPRAAAPIAPRKCASPDGPEAKVVEGSTESLALARSAAPAGSRVGKDWCQTFVQAGNQKIVVLKATGAGPGPNNSSPESALLVVYSDSGGTLEVVKLPKVGKFLVLDHGIAEMSVLETFDGSPNLAQIGRWFAHSPEVRARVKIKPDGSTQVEIPKASN